MEIVPINNPPPFFPSIYDYSEICILNTYDFQNIIGHRYEIAKMRLKKIVIIFAGK